MFFISRLFRVTVTSRKTEDLVVLVACCYPCQQRGYKCRSHFRPLEKTLSISLSEEKAAGCINTNPSSVKHSHRNLTVTWEFSFPSLSTWVPFRLLCVHLSNQLVKNELFRKTIERYSSLMGKYFQGQFFYKRFFNNDHRKNCQILCSTKRRVALKLTR